MHALSYLRNTTLPEIRTTTFRRNELLERLLVELNTDLQPSEKQLSSQYDGQIPPRPIVLIMGPLRSGTTLFMQWLAQTGLVAYPTNLLSRFYQAPIIGAKIQLLLTDPRYNFRDELGELTRQSDFRSENGKTEGVMAPNEFWYFWRQFLADPARDVWSDDELRQSMDIGRMRAELAGLIDVFGRPFAAKGMLFNYNIPFFDTMFENVLFIQMRRDPVANVASALDARRRQLGSESFWYSFSIPEFEMLKELDPVSQTAGQVHFNSMAVAQGLSKVAENRKLVVDYEDFCTRPEHYYELLYRALGAEAQPYRGPSEFNATRQVEGKAEKAIRAALQKFGDNPHG